MNQLLPYLIQSFKWTLSVSIMDSVLAVLILLVKTAFINKLSVRWQYLIWIVLLLKLILPWAPESSFSLYNLLPLTQQIGSTVTDSPAAVQTGNVDRSPVPLQQHSTADAPKKLAGEPASSGSLPRMPAVWNLLSACWLCGMLLFGIFLLGSNRKFASTVRKSSPITDDGMLRIFEGCKSSMSIRANIPLMKTTVLAAPTLFGLWRSCILLPEDVLKSLEHSELRHVFLHEFAHFKRKDIAVNWFMTLLLAIHWFNPLLWYAYYRVRADQEISCDALALLHIEENETVDYGRTMIKMLEQLSQPSRLPGAANFSGNRSQIKKRITMIKRFKRTSYRWSLLGLSLVILLSAAALTHTKSKDADPSRLSNAAIEEHLNKIVNNKAVSLSSNPNDYIQANPDSFNAILNQRDTGLQFLLAELRKSGQDGLREWVMAKACAEMVSGKVTIRQWSTGKEWLKKYENSITQLLYENSKYNFSLDLPRSWEGKYEVQEKALDIGVNLNFINKATQYGVLFQVSIWSKQYWNEQGPDILSTIGSHVTKVGETTDKVYLIITPTDVQYDPSEEKSKADYLSMFENVAAITGTFQLKNGSEAQQSDGTEIKA